MSAWIFGVIGANLLVMCGAVSLGGMVLGIFGAALVGLAGWARHWRELAFGLAGVAWGAYYSGELPKAGLAAVEVVRPGPFVLMSGSVLVRSAHDGRVYLAQGIGRRGERGRVICRARPGLLGPTHCQFRSARSGDRSPRLVMGQPLSALRRRLLALLETYPADVRGWFGGILVGEQGEVAAGLKNQFRTTGLYHLLVVSGFHVSLAAMAGRSVLGAPFRISYSLGLVPPRVWVHLSMVLTLMSAGLAMAYGALVGLGPACQRALILHLILLLGPMLSGSLSLATRLKLGALLQSVLFPVGLLSISGILSWGTYLLVIGAFMSRGRTFGRRFLTLCDLQLRLLVLVWAAIGELSLMGLLANLLIGPLFTLVFIGAVVALGLSFVDGTTTIVAWLITGQRWFLEGVSALARIGDQLFGGSWQFGSEPLAVWVRGATVLLAGILLLETGRRIGDRHK